MRETTEQIKNANEKKRDIPQGSMKKTNVFKKLKSENFPLIIHSYLELEAPRAPRCIAKIFASSRLAWMPYFTTTIASGRRSHAYA